MESFTRLLEQYIKVEQTKYDKEQVGRNDMFSAREQMAISANVESMRVQMVLLFGKGEYRLSKFEITTIRHSFMNIYLKHFFWFTISSQKENMWFLFLFFFCDFFKFRFLKCKSFYILFLVS